MRSWGADRVDRLGWPVRRQPGASGWLCGYAVVSASVTTGSQCPAAAALMVLITSRFLLVLRHWPRASLVEIT